MTTSEDTPERPDTPIPDVVGVVGGGRMGAGIAHAFLTAGAQVVLIDTNSAAVADARDRVARYVERSGQGAQAGRASAQLERLVTSPHLEDLRDAGLIVEAVPENFELKAQVLRAVEAIVGDDAVIASNTSSLSITAISGALARPAHFLGMHFFNPVPVSSLVEVVVGEGTDATTRDAVSSWATAIGKTPIVVGDSPGFASSRLGLALGLEAIRMVESGVASESDIDAAMTLGYGHPIGPLALTDLVGLDVRLAISEHLASELGERFAPPALLRRKVADGHLGRKTGRGFYDWSSGKAKAITS